MINTKENYLCQQTIHLQIMYIYLTMCKQMNGVKLLLLHDDTWNHLTVEK